MSGKEKSSVASQAGDALRRIPILLWRGYDTVLTATLSLSRGAKDGVHRFWLGSIVSLVWGGLFLIAHLIYDDSPWAYVLGLPDRVAELTNEQVRLGERIGMPGARLHSILVTVTDQGELLEQVTAMAQDGDVLAQYFAGYWRDVTPVDETLKYKVNRCDTGAWREWVERSARGGNPRAAGYVAWRLTAGAFRESAGQEAVAWARQAARWREPLGLWAMGRIHATGFGVERNPEQAARYYTLALHFGRSDWTDAWVEFADFILSGRAADRREDALEMYWDAAQQSGRWGVTRYAHEMINRTMTDAQEARLLTRLKQDATSSTFMDVKTASLYTLGMWLQQRTSSVASPYDSVALLKQSADAGYSPAQLEMARIARRNNDPERAWFWVILAMSSPIEWDRPCAFMSESRRDPLVHVAREASELLAELKMAPTGDAKQAVRRCLSSQQQGCLQYVDQLTTPRNSREVPQDG